MDLFTLGLRADTRDLKRGQREMDSFAKTGEKTERRINRSMDKTGRSFGGVRNEARLLQGALVSLGLVGLSREVIEYADAWSGVTSSLRQVTDSEQSLIATRTELVMLSRQTRSDLGATVSLYTELYRSTRDLDVSQQRVAGVTKTINNLFLAGGKSAADTAGAVRQLAQGLSAGALRGDEFNSVAEGAPRIMDALSQSLNMTRGELREFAATGGITTQIIVEALESYSDQAQKMADQTDKTFGQSLTVAKTNATEFTGETNALTSAVGLAGDGVIAFSENLDVLTNVVTGAVLVASGRMVGSVAAATAQMLAAQAQAARYQATLATMAGVSHKAAAGQLALAKATGLAGRGLSLIGGPAGAAALAAFGVGVWADKLADSSRHGVTATKNNKHLASSYGELNQQLILLGKTLDSTVTSTDTQNATRLKGLQQQQAATKQAIAGFEAMGRRAISQERQYRFLLETLKNLNAEINELTATPEEKADLATAKALDDLNAKLQEQIDAYNGGELALKAYNREQQISTEVARLAKGDLAGETEAIRAKVAALYDAKDAHALAIESEREQLRIAEEKRRTEERAKAQSDGIDAEIASMQMQLDLINEGKAAEEAALEVRLRALGATERQIELYGEAQKQLDALNKTESKDSTLVDQAKNADDAIASSIRSFQALSDEGSDTYKRLGAAAQIFEQISLLSDLARTTSSATSSAAIIAGKTAEGTAAAAAGVAGQASGDPYTAFARMAAMAGAMASIGFAVKGAFGGSDSGFDLGAVQSAQGSGSVLGDAKAQSESIANAMESLEKNSEIETGYSAQMLRQLQQLNANIGGLGTLLARQFGNFTLNDPNVSQFNSGNIISDSIRGGLDGIGKFTGLSGINDAIAGVTGIDVLGLVGDVLGGLGDGLFGKTKASVVNSGIAIQSQNLGDLMADGLAGASVDALQFATIKIKKSSWFSSSTKYRRQTSQLGGDVERQLGLVMGGLYNSVLSGAEAAFGIDASSALNALNLESVDISLRGLSGDERTEALSAVFGSIGDEMAAVVPRLSEFQQAGEGLFETLGRVGADVVRAEYQLEQFGLTMGDIYAVAGEAGLALELIRGALADNAGAAAGMIESFAGTESELVEFADRIFDLQTTFGLMSMSVDSLTESMIRGAGGSANLSAGVDSYIEAFLSDAEQLAIQRGRLSSTLGNAGIDLPATRQAYRDLIEGLDLGSSEGQRMAGALFASAEAADKLYSTIEDAQAEQLQVVADLRGLASSAQEIYSPNSLSMLQKSFFATANQARGGDLSSASSLVGIGQGVLSAAANEARSQLEYERIAATVAGTANSIANAFDIPTELDLQQQQLTVLEEIRDQSAPMTGQANEDKIAALEARLSEMTEQLRDGFFAVTKQTMKTAKVLDRWDGDGLPEERVA